MSMTIKKQKNSRRIKKQTYKRNKHKSNNKHNNKRTNKKTKIMKGGRTKGKAQGSSQNKKQQSKKQQPKNVKNVTLKKLKCSPKDNNEVNDYTCYTDNTLHRLRDNWNKHNKGAQIHTNNTREIHNQLKHKLANVCDKESCWLKQKDKLGNVKDEINNSFAPEQPKEWKKNPNEWLSSDEITDVMKQYEKAYKCFKFIGPTPIDFDKRKMYGECVWDELCNLDLKEMKKHGKFKIGIIFNTDPHDKGGQHWISMFINIKTGLIFFYDSTGDHEQPEITKLVKRLIKQGTEMKPPIHFKYDTNNGIQHQKGNTECGMYSLYFIVHMLKDKLSKNYMKTHNLDDKYISNFRKIYFNDEL